MGRDGRGCYREEGVIDLRGCDVVLKAGGIALPLINFCILLLRIGRKEVRVVGALMRRLMDKKVNPRSNSSPSIGETSVKVLVPDRTW